ncbi:hypothetical protein VFPFJ_08734 [Purpureocillium lilacinum]|uniref:Uncharacterized protein n=1 Tax=Purpureocillium lilacinum TaxID=33203 RepID=A0A179H0C4_PURLI|nr:hypothetical protein VFPFJ_08734 [Purpureocillium lilacinum]OAQ74822.1 hypothetical protein VFPBJ_10117 [Purpureocillium lilacinum]OAQ82931.1 hypothetical protein VFPFJ_08734 [Purpureocillium lilacinum]
MRLLPRTENEGYCIQRLTCIDICSAFTDNHRLSSAPAPARRRITIRSKVPQLPRHLSPRPDCLSLLLSAYLPTARHFACAAAGEIDPTTSSGRMPRPSSARQPVSASRPAAQASPHPPDSAAAAGD